MELNSGIRQHVRNTPFPNKGETVAKKRNTPIPTKVGNSGEKGENSGQKAELVILIISQLTTRSPNKQKTFF